MSNQKYNNTIIAILTTLDQKIADYGYAVANFLKCSGTPCCHQQVYRELRALEKLELVSRKDVPIEGKPDRGIYTITVKGRQFLLTAEPDTLSKITTFDLALCFKTQRFIDWALKGLEVDIASIKKNIHDDLISSGKLLIIETKIHILNNLPTRNR